jgi:hypothetical protein
MEVGGSCGIGAAEQVEGFRGEMKDLAFGVGYDSGGAWLVSIEADLTEHGSPEEGSESNLDPVFPLEEHGRPAGHDQEDPGARVALSHQLIAGGNGAGRQVGG